MADKKKAKTKTEPKVKSWRVSGVRIRYQQGWYENGEVIAPDHPVFDEWKARGLLVQDRN